MAGRWDGLSISERVIFSAVAEAQKIAAQVPEEPLTLLKNFGVIETESLIQAVNQLADANFLDNTRRRVKIELVRRWLVQRHPLRQEIWELENLDQEEVNRLWEVATKLHQQNKKQNALTLYQQILELNPNHFTIIVALAEGYLEVEEFDKAAALYTRAYQVDPVRNKERLLHALQSSGQKLIKQREFTQAQEQFNRILEIEPSNQLAREKLRKDYNWVEAGGRRRNPYIIGRPIEERESFFGRESLFRFIEDNLQQNVKVILLHGQRRIGKSSVLKLIPQFFAQFSQNEFVFVNFDLQDKANLSLSQVLHLLATEIFTLLCDYLEPTGYDRVILPSNADFETDTDIFSLQFLPQVYQELGDKNLVLLLDEFDVLSDNHTQSAQEHFFSYLKGLIERHERLFIIPVTGRNLDDLPKLLSLFGRPPYQEIGLLDELSAQRLITRPVQGMLEYDPGAIKAILELSAGHPYFTQIICNALFGQARTENKFKITCVDVDNIVNKAIDNAEGGLDWFWHGLPTPEQVVFSAVAEAQRIAISQNQLVPEEPLMLLTSYGVIQTESLIQANHQLADKGFLDNTERRVKIELVRQWLIQRHPLWQEIWQLENLELKEVNPLWKVATELRQQGKKRNAVAYYELILEINPNHFSSVVALAEEYLEVEDFDKAVELYTRAYLFDPIRNQEGLLRALQASGQKLIDQREFIRAKEQLNQVLEIEPDNRAARMKLLETEVAIEPKTEASQPESLVLKNNNSSQYSSQQKYNSVSILLPTIAATAGIITILGGIGVYHSITSCSRSEQKVLGISCAVAQSRISRGERTLFPSSIKNTNLDLGIEAFKQGKHSEAAELFKISVAANPSDPELLIYYNNARAQQQKSPLTLAAVVPVDNAESTAQEILRGVAQAQNQFNEKGGLDGRLLEIAIANDDNKPDKAQQVAAELVKDSSVLGVIGHNSSNATNAALAEYEKAGLAIISPTSASTSLTSDVFFGTVPSDAATGNKLAEYAKNSLGLNKILIFFNRDSVYSNSLREEFTKKFEQLKGQVVRKDLTDPKLSLEKEVSKSQARAVVLFPDTQYTSVALETAKVNANLIASSQNSKRLGLKLLGGDTLYSQNTLLEGGKAVEGLILAVPWFREAPQSKNFEQAAEHQWGGPVSWRTATSFDATQAFIKALSANPSRSTVLQRLQQVNLPSSETSGDTLKFTEGERQSQPILVKVDKGKFVLVK